MLFMSRQIVFFLTSAFWFEDNTAMSNMLREILVFFKGYISLSSSGFYFIPLLYEKIFTFFKGRKHVFTWNSLFLQHLFFTLYLKCFVLDPMSVRPHLPKTPVCSHFSAVTVPLSRNYSNDHYDVQGTGHMTDKDSWRWWQLTNKQSINPTVFLI